jgi:hypothetical protein
MTTFSAYLDALANESSAAQRARSHWLLSPRTQLTALYLIDSLVLVVALLVSITVSGLLPVEPNTDGEQIVRWAAPLLTVSWLVALYLFGASQLRHLRAGVT